MYRTRAEAISGTKVFAGGKWLQCIGNKNFHVGELVWTDGGCVFGNYREIQQPLVIPTLKKDNFAIPIICGSCATFFNGKFNVLEGRNYRNFFMINDKKGNVYTFYSGINGRYGIIAANIDETGYIFTLYVDDILNNLSVNIRNNNEIVSECNFNFIADEMKTDCPDVPPVWSIPAANDYYFSEGYSIRWAFIENINKWAFIVLAEYDKGVYEEPLLPNGQIIAQREEHVLTRWYYFDDCGNKKILYEYFEAFRPSNFEDELLESYTSTPDLYDVKFPLQDNFFYKSEHFLIKDNGYSSVNGEKRTFFSPDGTKIFTGIFFAFSYITLKKVQSSYLLGVNTSLYVSGGMEILESIGMPLFSDGLFLLKNGSWEVLSDASSCANQRLRPMTKFKNWNKRIKSLT